jgi:Immunoglobulin I-set domain
MRMALFLRSTAFACAEIIAGSVLIGCSGYTSGGSTPAAPVITTQPANQTVSVGQAAAFTVAATGTPPLSYQWQKNGAAISGATSSSYATPATTAADNGAQFRVVVSNSAGSVTSSAASLTVNSGPPPQLQITTTSLPNGQLQTAYSATCWRPEAQPPIAGALPRVRLPPGSRSPPLPA